MIELNFDKCGGLVPVIAQDYLTNEVLMMAFMNRDAWRKTLELKEAVYFSRTRNCLWHKGETSGNVQRIKEILVDCDEDTVLLKVEQIGGAACHTGHKSCFFRRIVSNGVEETSAPVFDPDKVYGK